MDWNEDALLSLFSSVQLLSHVRLFELHESQHERPPCPSPTPGVHSDSCPSSQWCHLATSSSVVPFSSCPQSLPASESFPMSQLFAWGGQSTGVSALASVLTVNTQDWSPWLDLLASIFHSIRVFSNESVLHIRWPKYWNFSFNISPSNEHPRLISFRMDRMDLLVVQGTLMSLLQHHSSKASILQCSDFFIVQLSYPYMTTRKTIALTRRTFVGKVMFLLLNMLSRLVITFLPGSKRLLISWLQSPSAVILEPKKIKSATVSTVSPSICHK